MTQDNRVERFMGCMYRLGRGISVAVEVNILTRGEFWALSMLQKHRQEHPDSQGVYVYAMAQHLRVKPPAVSRMLGNLERKGYIARSVDAEDRRNTFISITPEGERLVTETDRQVREYTQRVMDRMGAEHLDQMLTQMEQLAAIIEDERKKEKRKCSSYSDI